MHEFSYHHPATVDEAIARFAEAQDGLYLAGGQTLIPVLKQRFAMPSDVIEIGAIDGLAGVSEEAGSITVGAMTSHAEVAASPLVRDRIPAMASLAGMIGDPHVRNQGTLGGSIANADPSADYPAAILGLGATVHTNLRAIAGDAFFTGFFETALEEGELITHVTVPVPEKAAYAKFPNPASRYAVVGVFVARSAAGTRVAVTGAGASAFRVPDMEAALGGDFSAHRLDGIAVDAEDLNADMHASAAYRAHLIGVLAKRAVAAAG